MKDADNKFTLHSCAGTQGWYEVVRDVSFHGKWLPSKIERSVEEGRVVIRSAPPRQGKPESYRLCIGVARGNERS